MPGGLHLDPADALLDPTAELAGQPVQRVIGESAAAVDRHLVVERGQDLVQRLVEQPARRSHSAMSTAETAIVPMPGRPALRSRADVERQVGAGDSASTPTARLARAESIRWATAMSPYV